MLSVAAFLGSAVPSTVEVCPGEGPRYGDFKCNHDGTHRVCAQLIDNTSHAPLKWGTGDFWDLTGQKAFQWSDRIVAPPNPGDSWCICMWATASLIKQAGCDNVHLRCDSTDVAYVLGQYHDGGVELSAAHDCLEKKCPAQVAAVQASAAPAASEFRKKRRALRGKEAEL